MIFRNRFQDPKVMIRIAMVCLLLASLSRWFLHPEQDFWRGVADGVTGMFFGIFITLSLLAVRLNARRKELK